MTDDEVLAEVRRIRLAYGERFHFDLDAIFRDIREQERLARLAGQTFVRLPPKRNTPSVEARSDEESALGELESPSPATVKP